MSDLHAYVEEVGDDGLSEKSSSQWYCLVAYVAKEQDLAALKNDINLKLGTIFGRRIPDNVHFKKQGPQRKRRLVQIVCDMDINITCVLAHKQSFTAEQRSRLVCPKLHHLMLKFLIERLTWYANDKRSTINITLAKRKQIHIANVRTYIFETLKELALIPNCNINYTRLGDITEAPISADRMLQPADWIAGSVGAGLNPNGAGTVNTEFTEALLRKFWKRTGFWTYGMKIIPTTFDRKKETLFQRVQRAGASG